MRSTRMLDDAGLGVDGVGEDAGLAAGERRRRAAKVGEGHRHQGHGLALAGGDQHVHLPAGPAVGDLGWPGAAGRRSPCPWPRRRRRRRRRGAGYGRCGRRRPGSARGRRQTCHRTSARRGAPDEGTSGFAAIRPDTSRPAGPPHGAGQPALPFAPVPSDKRQRQRENAAARAAALRAAQQREPTAAGHRSAGWPWSPSSPSSPFWWSAPRGRQQDGLDRPTTVPQDVGCVGHDTDDRVRRRPAPGPARPGREDHHRRPPPAPTPTGRRRGSATSPKPRRRASTGRRSTRPRSTPARARSSWPSTRRRRPVPSTTSSCCPVPLLRRVELRPDRPEHRHHPGRFADDPDDRRPRPGVHDQGRGMHFTTDSSGNLTGPTRTQAGDW